MDDIFLKLKAKLVEPPVLGFPQFYETFIVETEASRLYLGALLSQKKESKQNAIQLASFMMTAAERRWLACEREALADMFVLKHLRLYLLSFLLFKFITSHQPLQYAFRKRAIHGRLARWMHFLSEFEFEMKYRPGESNHVAE